MGILQNPLGINLTNHDPLKDSPFNNSFDEGMSPTPPGESFFLLTDNTPMELAGGGASFLELT